MLLVPDLELATLSAIGYLRALRPARVRPLYLGDPSTFAAAAAAWPERAPRFGDLELLEGGHDRPVRALRAYLHDLPRAEDSFVTVVVPEVVRPDAWLATLRGRAALRIKPALLFLPGVVVTDVPLLPEEREQVLASASRPTEPGRSVVIVPISAAHDASVRAVTYAQTLNATTTDAYFFTTDPTEVEGLIAEWHARRMGVPLVLVEAPFRDFGEPLLAEIRRETARGDTAVTVVLPEFIPSHWWENALHNQTAFYIKRLLLREDRKSTRLNSSHVSESRMPSSA